MEPSPLPPPFSSQIFSVREAREWGLSRARTRASDLQSPYQGVRAPAAELTLVQRCRALQTKLPSYAFFSGPTAAGIRGVPLPCARERSERVHVTVPESKRAPVGRGVAGHAARLRAGDVLHWGDLRLSSAERTWCELGASLDLPQLVAAGDYLIHRELPQTSTERLRSSLQSFPGRRGRRRLSLAIDLLDDGAESPRESLIRVLLALAGVTGYRTNVSIDTSSGHRYRGDLVFLREKVIVEYHGKQHVDVWLNDTQRKSRLQADGWLVVEITALDLADPRELVARVRRALAGRA